MRSTSRALAIRVIRITGIPRTRGDEPLQHNRRERDMNHFMSRIRGTAGNGTITGTDGGDAIAA